MNLGLGAEFRYEKYSIYRGERASYNTFPNPYMQAAGAQGLPGFSPSDEVKAHRSTIGAYVDEKLNITKAWENSYTFHGRDVYAYTAARLAAGVIVSNR